MKSAKTKPSDNAAKPKKSELRREAILKQALALFDLHGFANTSLDDIARATGVKREAIYYYFKNRAEILLYIIRPQTAALVEGVRTIVESDSDATSRLHQAIRNRLQRFNRNCLEMTISRRDVYLDDAKDVRREMDKIWRQYENMWTRIVEEGRTSGEFSYCGSPKMIAFAILGMCNWLARWYDPRKSVSVGELIETYFEMLAHGLVRQPSDRRRAPRRRGEPASAAVRRFTGRRRRWHKIFFTNVKKNGTDKG